MAPMDIYNRIKSYYFGQIGCVQHTVALRHDAGHKLIRHVYRTEACPINWYFCLALGIWRTMFVENLVMAMMFVHDEKAQSIEQALLVALYVVPFYLSRKTRPSPSLNRDAPSVIRARIQTVTVAVVISLLVTFYLLRVTGKHTFLDSLHYLGLYPIDPTSILSSLGLTLVLYLAPLYETIFIDRDLSPYNLIPGRIKESLASSQGYRNYIAGPLTEELLFRSSIVTLHLLAHISPTKITFLTPLYFGIAHLHHFYEFRLTHSHEPVNRAIFRSIFQLGYTTIFGWYAAFVYIRTGNLYAVFIIHVFCNWMGLPRLWGKVRRRNEPTLSSTMIRGKEDMDSVGRGQSGRDQSLSYTVIYYILLFGGAYGFSRMLFPLTEAPTALASFSKRVAN